VIALPVLEQPDVQACCAPLASEVLSEPDAQVLARQFAALADPVRLRLVSLLATADEFFRQEMLAVTVLGNLNGLKISRDQLAC